MPYHPQLIAYHLLYFLEKAKFINKDETVMTQQVNKCCFSQKRYISDLGEVEREYGTP